MFSLKYVYVRERKRKSKAVGSVVTLLKSHLYICSYIQVITLNSTDSPLKAIFTGFYFVFLVNRFLMY